jgi:hypothetical protein
MSIYTYGQQQPGLLPIGGFPPDAQGVVNTTAFGQISDPNQLNIGGQLGPFTAQQNIGVSGGNLHTGYINGFNAGPITNMQAGQTYIGSSGYGTSQQSVQQLGPIYSENKGQFETIGRSGWETGKYDQRSWANGTISESHAIDTKIGGDGIVGKREDAMKIGGFEMKRDVQTTIGGSKGIDIHERWQVGGKTMDVDVNCACCCGAVCDLGAKAIKGIGKGLSFALGGGWDLLCWAGRNIKAIVGCLGPALECIGSVISAVLKK